MGSGQLSMYCIVLYCKTNQREINLPNIIIKIVQEARAIPVSSVNLIHNPCGIDADLLVNSFCTNQYFSQISSSLFATSVSELTYTLFYPVMGRLQMEPHDYQGINYRSLHSLKDVHLIDFLNLSLKSNKDYTNALDVVLQTAMGEYLSKYLVFLPRQIVYQKASHATETARSVPQGCSPHPLCSVIPTLGPLHVDLHADEDIIVSYMPFIRCVYESVFPGKELADKPKPWEDTVSVGDYL